MKRCISYGIFAICLGMVGCHAEAGVYGGASVGTGNPPPSGGYQGQANWSGRIILTLAVTNSFLYDPSCYYPENSGGRHLECRFTPEPSPSWAFTLVRTNGGVEPYFDGYACRTDLDLTGIDIATFDETSGFERPISIQDWNGECVFVLYRDEPLTPYHYNDYIQDLYDALPY
jgi:hypothetical protein